MESLVEQPGAAQTRSSVAVGEGCGILPGRLPFIAPLRLGLPPPWNYSPEGGGWLWGGPEQMWRKGYGTMVLDHRGVRAGGPRFPPDGRSDANHQILGRLRPAFHA